MSTDLTVPDNAVPETSETSDRWEAQKQRAAELMEQLRTALLSDRASAWAVAEALYHMNQEVAWVALGHDNLSQFLADPDVGLSRTTFYRYVSVYEELVVRRQLPVEDLLDLDITKADVVLGAIRDAKVPLEDAVSDARTLGKRDLQQKYTPPKPKPLASSTGGTPAPVPTHDGTPDVEPVSAAAVTQEEHGESGDSSPSTGSLDSAQDRLQAAASTVEAPEDEAVIAVAQEPGDEPEDTEGEVVTSEVADIEGREDLEGAVMDLQEAWSSGDTYPRIKRETLRILLEFFVEGFVAE